jgi:hypothetical protein
MVAAVLAGLFLIAQDLPSSDPVVLANASAQMVVVSIAEVVVAGPSLVPFFGMPWPGVMFAGVAIVFAAFVFGVYHFAHSAPFARERSSAAVPAFRGLPHSSRAKVRCRPVSAHALPSAHACSSRPSSVSDGNRQRASR